MIIPGMTILITLAALCVIAYGLLTERELWDLEEGQGLLSRLRKKRDRILRAMKDIEFEHQAGTLSEEEFRGLRNEFKLRAIAATRDLDRVRKSRLRSLERRGRGLSPSERKRIEELVRAARERQLARAAGAAAKEGAR